MRGVEVRRSILATSLCLPAAFGLGAYVEANTSAPWPLQMGFVVVVSPLIVALATVIALGLVRSDESWN